MTDPVRYSVQDGIAVIAVDNPPVNALSQAVRAGLAAAVARLAGDDQARAGVIYGTGRTFIAGADIREFGKPMAEPFLPDVIAAIEACGKPVVAALHGTALGGGLEVALGCHARVAVSSAKVGLPEVTLGILPGAGGTQRLPRLAGAAAALDLITSGRHVAAVEAVKLGIIDAVVDGDDPLAAGLAFARRLVEGAVTGRRSGEIDPGAKDEALFADWRAKTMTSARGQISPMVAIDAIEAAYDLPFTEGMARERALFKELMASDQRAGLIHAFFAERAVAKIPEAETASPREVASIGVIGGGTMGSGIAVAALNAGLPVTLVERDEASAERARGFVAKLLDDGVRRGKLSEARRDQILLRDFSTATDYAALAETDLVIEAVFEDMDVKKDVFARLDGIAKAGAILATNTSYLDVNEIAAATARPQDVIGFHFFSPAHVMRLLEVVVADKTAADVVATGFALAKTLRKVAVRAGVCDGFIGNRLLNTYRKAADYMVEDGASPYQIDAALVAFGFPMGPFAVSDLAGLDIAWAGRKRRAATRDPRERTVGIADRICERGWFGQKSGRGYYLYEPGARRGSPDPEVEAIIAAEREAKGIVPRSFSDAEIVSRYMAAMINEAAKIVDEGIALRPLDVDVTMLAGYGFPRWRGGPMHYADRLGLDTVLAELRRLSEEDAFFWEPAPLLVRLAEDGKTFASLNGRD
ncbi:3-hydroxyacyl-CoA dehydrogenase NAD-binding domain-containing protein [Stappia sp. TSB10GB4]|uniref:3-hydroxyacyl-CoA dehydrogenase NAD-binding domain-containing protein n=1 Tax=Stappia sp. TSB10GB4 TaxID=2003584 RepID=UPI001FCE4FAA|nr:3-hydroxyacyl-CoA dehydrogenase NAD-binding domain-containing protein [Stappia sp. TSB10GB4]